MKIRSILFLFMGLLLVTSCTFRLSKEDKETMSQTLSVKPFEKVDVIGAYEVIYRQQCARGRPCLLRETHASDL